MDQRTNRSRGIYFTELPFGRRERKEGREWREGGELEKEKGECWAKRTGKGKIDRFAVLQLESGKRVQVQETEGRGIEGIEREGKEIEWESIEI